MRFSWIYYPVALAALVIAVAILVEPVPDIDSFPWFILAALLGSNPALLARTFRFGYTRARLDYWARAAEARRRGLTVIEFVASELDRDLGDKSA